MNILRNGLAAVMAGILFLSIVGCEGTSLASDTTIKTDSLESEISTTQLELDHKDNLLADAIKKVDSVSKELFNCKQEKEACKNNLIGSNGVQIIKVDTCFASLKLSDQVKEQLEAKDQYILALIEQKNGFQTQLKVAKGEIKGLEQNLLSIEDSFLSITGDSPHYSEKATISRGEDGIYIIQFQKVQPLEDKIEEIIEEVFADVEPTQNGHYPFSLNGGWMVTNDLSDFRSFQGYTFGGTWRPFKKGHIGVGLQGTYSDRNVKRFTPNVSRFGLGVELEYNFRIKNK